MVPTSRRARGWFTYVAQATSNFVYWLHSLPKGPVPTERINRQNEASTQSPTVKPQAPGKRFRDYEHATEGEHRTAEQFYWRRSFRLNVLVGAAAVTTVLYARGAYFESKRQAVAAEGQLAEAKRQTIVSENGSKPYILPIIKGDRVYVTPQQINLTEPSFPFLSILSFKNFGTTPAIITSIKVQFGLSPEAGYPATEYHTTGLILEAKGEHVMGYNPPMLITLAGQDYRHLVMGETAIYLNGVVSYTDVAGTPHLSRFCFAQNISGKGGLRTDLQPASGPSCTNKVD